MTFVKYIGQNTITVKTETQHALGDAMVVSTNDIVNVSHKEFFLVNETLLRNEWKIATAEEIQTYLSGLNS